MKKRKKPRRPSSSDVRSVDEFYALPYREQLRREQALRALWLMRNRGMSREAAAKEVGAAPRSVQKIVGQSLQKVGGRYQPAKGDRLLRIMVVPAPGGRVELAVRGSRNASQISAYDRAVKHYIYTGDPTSLSRFDGKTIMSGRQRVPLLTDQRALDRLARAHAISFESIYALTV